MTNTLSTTARQDLVVQRLNDANTALAQAVTIPQFKLVSDVAAAQEVFATRIGYAHELKIEALAGLGELIKQAPKRTASHFRVEEVKGLSGTRYQTPRPRSPSRASTRKRRTSRGSSPHCLTQSGMR